MHSLFVPFYPYLEMVSLLILIPLLQNIANFPKSTDYFDVLDTAEYRLYSILCNFPTDYSIWSTGITIKPYF